MSLPKPPQSWGAKYLRWRGDRIAVVTLAVGLFSSLIVFVLLRQHLFVWQQHLFSRNAISVLSKIKYRLDEYAHALYGARGLFANSEDVSSEDWKAFVESRSLENEFPGLRGLGFVRYIQRSELDSYLKEYDFANHSHFVLRTDNKHPDMFPITFLEPGESSRRAIGFDVGSEPMRRTAAEWSAKTGQPGLTRRVELVQDPEKKAAVLYFLPIYDEKKGEANPFSPKRLYGFVLAPIRVDGLMKGIVEDSGGIMDIQVYDGDSNVPSPQLLYNSENDRSQESEFTEYQTFESGSQTWKVVFKSRPNFVPYSEQLIPWSGLGVGTLVSFLLTALVYSLRASQMKAEALTDLRTRDLLLTTEELANAKDKALAATRTKSMFLANMSHEIRSPLTAIIGYSEILQEDQLSKQESAEAVGSILQNGKHLLGVINDILDFSKIEAGALAIEILDVSVADLISDVGNLMRMQAGAKGLTFAFEYLGPIPNRIKTDPTRLKQILFNLIGNAIKFTRKGGVRVELRCEWADGVLSFAVRDSGIGMTEDQRAKLFSAFVQADTSTTREFGGTGLGLVISHQLVQKLGGDIFVQSKPGEGSTFTASVVTGSLEGVEALGVRKLLKGDSVGPAETVGPLSGRVLLAEDSVDNQRLISHLLRKNGFEVVVAENGEAAIEAIYSGEFDLVLMDMQMPILDGYSATQRLRREGFLLPIIALTANTLIEDRKRCLDAGCDDFIGKPFERAYFLSKISEIFGGRPENADVVVDRRSSQEIPAPVRPKKSSAEPLLPAPDCVDDDTFPVIVSFVNNLPSRLSVVRDRFNDRDFGGMKEVAHMLRSAALFGYPDLGVLAGAVEDGANGKCENLEPLITEMEIMAARIAAGIPFVTSLRGNIELEHEETNCE